MKEKMEEEEKKMEKGDGEVDKKKVVEARANYGGEHRFKR